MENYYNHFAFLFLCENVMEIHTYNKIANNTTKIKSVADAQG